MPNPLTPLKDHHGRGVNTITKEYTLPADQAEMDRLSRQHRLWRTFLAGLYPRSLSEVISKGLERKNGERSLVLDIGCGSGIWTVEMGEEFPDVEVVGLDLVVPRYPSNVPTNVRFMQQDIREGLAAFHGQADLINCRLVVFHMADPQGLVATISSCLKPGGLVILSDIDGKVYDEDKKVLLPLTPSMKYDTQDGAPGNRSWWAGYRGLWYELAQSPKYKAVDTLLADNGGFSAIECSDFFVPMHRPDKDDDEMGSIAYENNRGLVQAFKLKILESGLSNAVVEDWITEIEKELCTRRMYTRCRVASALKILG